MSVQELSASGLPCTHMRESRLMRARGVLRAAEHVGGSVGSSPEGADTGHAHAHNAVPRKRRLTRAERMSGTARAVREQLELADRRCDSELGALPASQLSVTPPYAGHLRPASHSVNSDRCGAASSRQEEDPLCGFPAFPPTCGPKHFLRLGAVHELCGLFMGTGVAMDTVGPRAANSPSAIVPHGCLIHILHQVLGTKTEDGHSPLERGIAWIGSRMHPDVRALRRAQAGACDSGADQAILRHSVFIHDASDGGAQGSDAAIANRLWCAEQALRMGAVGAVIVDGTGFGTLAWRRLQLAAAAGKSVHEGDASALVLVVTQPSSVQPRGCAATTRWSVHAAVDAEHSFRWRMRLESVRGGLGGLTDGAGLFIKDGMRARLEAGEIFVDIKTARPAFGVDQWRAVQMWRARRSSVAVPVHEAVHETVHARTPDSVGSDPRAYANDWSRGAFAMALSA